MLSGKHDLLDELTAYQVAEALDKENIYLWDGNCYAPAVTERLGLEASGGMVRVGPVQATALHQHGGGD